MITKEYIPYVKRVEVTEHRAPTDDSIRLYKEMEEKAVNNIIGKEIFKDNELNGVVLYVEYGAPINDIVAHIKFSLNGKQYHEKVEVERCSMLDRNNARRLLFLSIIEKLTQIFVIEFNKIKYL